MSRSFPLSDHDLRNVLGTFTHDLRNPLSAILSNLDFASRMAAQANLDPDLVEALTDSVSACNLFRRILANLDILAADGETGRSLNAAVGPLVDEVVDRLSAQAEQAGISLHVNGAVEATKVPLDPLTFALGVENLVANSLVHAPRGTTVTVTVEQTDQELRVHVDDHGPAIPMDLQELAVSPEGQTAGGRKPGSRYARGATLLAAQVIATLCGGTLRLDASDEGSRLTLAVPVPSAP